MPNTGVVQAPNDIRLSFILCLFFMCTCQRVGHYTWYLLARAHVNAHTCVCLCVNAML